jgi:O-antigen ligase
VNTLSARTTLPRAAVARLSSDTFWMAAFLVVMVSKIGDWLEALSAVPLVKITFGITLIVALRAGKIPSPIRAWSLRIARPAIVFEVLAMVSIFWSLLRSQTLLDMQSSMIFLIALVLLVKIAVVPRDLYRLLKGLAVAGALLTLGTLLQFAGGRAQISAWNSNDIAYALVTLLPLVLVQRAGRSAPARLALLGVAVLMVVATLLTASRGGAVGLAVVLATLTAFPLEPDSLGRLRPFKVARTLLRVVPVLLVAAFIWSHLPSDTTQRLATLEDIQGDYNMSNTIEASRTLIWRRDIMLALRRPWGYGMGTSYAVDGILGGGQYRTAHNSLVQVFVELGFLGLALYLTAYARAWKGLAAIAAAHRTLPTPESARYLLYARALGIALVGNFVAGFFLSQCYSGLFWMTIAICAAFARLGAPGYGVVPGSRAADSRAADRS